MGMKREFPLDSPKQHGTGTTERRGGGTRRFAGTPQVTILDGAMGDELRKMNPDRPWCAAPSRSALPPAVSLLHKKPTRALNNSRPTQLR